MGDKDDAAQDLYVAAYSDSSTAEEDWNALKGLAADDAIKVGALALVHRDSDGKLHVKDTTNKPGIGAVAGAIGGALVGLIFPPALLASAAVGAGIGAGTGTVIDRVTKRRIKSDVEWAVPVGGSGIVAGCKRSSKSCQPELSASGAKPRVDAHPAIMMRAFDGQWRSR